MEGAEVCCRRGRARKLPVRSPPNAVVHLYRVTLEAALWAVESSATFEQALVSAVNLGGDTDTVGAVTGALAEAKWGESAIPIRWLELLAWRRRIGAMALSLVRTSSEVHRV